MSKKVSFSLTDEQAEMFQEAKDLADQFKEKISEILMYGVRQYIATKKADKIQLFVGNRFNPDGALDGKYIAFQGKLLATGSRTRGKKENQILEFQELYKTLKGQYLLYKNNDGQEFYYDVYPTIPELMEKEALAIELMKALEEEGSCVKWLDI